MLWSSGSCLQSPVLIALFSYSGLKFVFPIKWISVSGLLTAEKIHRDRRWERLPRPICSTACFLHKYVMGILVTCCLLAWDVFSFPLFAQTVGAGEGEDENPQREVWYSSVLSGHIHFLEKNILQFADTFNSTNHSLIAIHIPVYLLLQSLQRKQNKSWYCGSLNRRIHSCFSQSLLCTLFVC